MTPPVFRPKYTYALHEGGSHPVQGSGPADPVEATDEAGKAGRVRLADLDTHLHCSVVGTCLTDAELRKVVGAFVDLGDASELQVHHEAVRLAGTHAQAARALHKALDRRYDPVVKRFAKARDEHAIETLWHDCLRRGEVPGAYWAVLSHRHTGPSLRQHVFGEVHMLSHLMGTSTRTDIRQRVALEADNATLRAQLEQLQGRYHRLVDSHDRLEQAHQLLAVASKAARERLASLASPGAPREQDASWVALQTEQRERAESTALHTAGENQRLREDLAHMHAELQRLADEVQASNTQWHHLLDADSDTASPVVSRLRGLRILYVGGRPSSAVAIREFVERAEGELRRHDGGLEDRKGQLASAIAWADRVMFPVDCIDHDSATNLKHQCTRLGIPFTPLRTASITSFIAGLAQAAKAAHADAPAPAPSHFCLRHG